ncbi:MAG: NADH-quinone oxidoreductase subunit NuoE [Planctomycetes bacterium]|nr:NADH-quinone oxidoreductase subunit NuoE [Planctomycetota bacterium]
MSVNVSNTACLDTEPLEKILASIPNAGPNDLVPILQQVQKAYGYLPKSILMAVSDRTGISASQIYGVATFYEQFYLEPHGRHTIRCCRGTACHVKGSPNIINAIQQALGIEPNETTEDMRYTFETVACLGTCFLAPVMMINNDYYGHLNARKIKSILERYA